MDDPSESTNNNISTKETANSTNATQTSKQKSNSIMATPHIFELDKDYIIPQWSSKPIKKYL